VRYADDFVILCRTELQAREALRRVEGLLGALGLSLHPEKTRVVFLGDGAVGFDFLGFHLHKVRSWRAPGRRYLLRWPSAPTLQRVRERIRAITAPRFRLKEPLPQLVRELNQLLRGWGAYFRVGNASRQFAKVDNYVRERLALFVSKKTQRSGRNWGSRYRWAFFQQLGVYRLSGTVTWYQAAPIAAR
jgi:RNA-directed DNA polymerase